MGFVLRRFFLLQVLLLALLGGARIAFYFVHGDAAARPAERVDWAAAALLGARFDLLVLAYLALPALLVLVAMAVRGRAGGPARWLGFARHWFFWGSLLLALIALIDFCFYDFYQDRLNVMLFGFFEDHTTAVLGMMWDLYPVPEILLGAAAFVWGLKVALRRILAPAAAPPTWGASRKGAAGLAFLLLIAGAGAARGSLGKFPLRARMASVSPRAFVNLCVLNGPFALKEAVQARISEDSSPLAPRLGFAEPAEAFASMLGLPAPGALDPAGALDMLRARTPAAPARMRTESAPLPPPHVVLVLMESLGAQLMRYQCPEFDLLGGFARHLPDGIVFTRALPEANSTIGTITALATGLPNRPNTTYLSQSRWADTALPTAPAGFFAGSGYDTLFLYGGHASWRRVDRFLPHQGFAQVEGLPAIHAALGLGEDDQAYWKTFDENTFRYLRERLRAAERPLYVVVLTATNHPPFEWLERFALPPLEPPAALRESLKAGAVEGRLRGTQYSMHHLGRFLDGLAEDGTLERTIVSVTGDHNTFDYASYGDGQTLDRFGVPIWLRVPESWRPAALPDLTAPVGHLDLMATLMHLALPAGAWHGFGTSVYDPAREPRVFHQEETESWSLGRAGAVQVGALGTRTWSFDPLDERRLVPSPSRAAHEALVRWARARLAAADHMIRWQGDRP
jgi:phosphoglycerol transferase MdoB-like AlkP superfamily enzyme